MKSLNTYFLDNGDIFVGELKHIQDNKVYLTGALRISKDNRPGSITDYVKKNYSTCLLKKEQFDSNKVNSLFTIYLD